jgi:lipid-binding SYLF domain-containing protein
MLSKTNFTKVVLITFLASMTYFSPTFADDAKEEAQEDKAAIAAFMESPVASKFHKSAYGYAVFPTIGKGGFGIGAAHGGGRVYAGGKKTGDVSMTQVSFGLQAGGQAYRQVIYFENKKAFDAFTIGEFEFGAQAEAIALTASAGVSAGTEGASASANESQSDQSKYFSGMVVFTMGKGGLMYQAALGGQKYSYTPAK